ncbi:MAG: hypothetical protein GWM87_10615 [Xanthomonadales bacterium]|nr:hypothetical protein [Xanthomonadales bacterium]NIX13338.1 hypothetical protein [Xanthomonadales bacterium]
MNEQLENHLRAMFAEAERQHDGREFTGRVMAQTRFARYRKPALVLGITLVVAVCMLLVAPPLRSFTMLVAQGLTTSLVDMGDGWLGILLAPVNTVGSLLILAGKAARIGQKRLLGAFSRT